jgi:hypothetical protein
MGGEYAERVKPFQPKTKAPLDADPLRTQNVAKVHDTPKMTAPEPASPESEASDQVPPLRDSTTACEPTPAEVKPTAMQVEVSNQETSFSSVTFVAQGLGRCLR